MWSNDEDYRQALVDSDEINTILDDYFDNYDEDIYNCEHGDHRYFEVLERTPQQVLFQCQLCGTVKRVTAQYINNLF